MTSTSTDAISKIDALPEHLRLYVLQTPAITGETVCQGHADVCSIIGHMTHTRDGVDQGMCPRCGEVTTPATTPGPVPTANTVSRKLRAEGMLPVPRHRQDGLSVWRGHRDGLVGLSAAMTDGDVIEQADAELDLITRATAILKAAGYAVTIQGNSLAYVTQVGA